MADATETTDQTQDAPPTGETPAGEQGAAPINFEEWYKGLPAEQQGAVDDHIDNLRASLKSERDEKRGLERRLRELSKQAEDGSELRQKLDQLAGETQTATAKAEFYEAGHAANVANLRLAWLAANDAGLVNLKTGDCDFEKLKTVAPELFRKPGAATVNAGNGATQTGVAKPSMNDWLRAASGMKR